MENNKELFQLSDYSCTEKFSVWNHVNTFFHKLHYHDCVEVFIYHGENGTHYINGKEYAMKNNNMYLLSLNDYHSIYNLPEKNSTDVGQLPIGDVAEELWIYSKSVELLTEPEDARYLAAETQGIQTNIAGMLRLLKNKLPSKDIDWLIEICNGVFSGKKFDDIIFNNVIEHFIQKKIEQ